MELKCSIQNYSWGKHGSDSVVATLIKSSNPEFVPKENVPYAELWMGTHPNGPSFLKNQNISLDEYIQKNDDVLGDSVKNIYGKKLPFLFKVLSIKKALSIQVHPNKEQALNLHKAQPDIYKDSNHKPEMAIALTPFEALCGFRPIDEIQNFLKSIPELKAVVGEDGVSKFNSNIERDPKSALKQYFMSLMTQYPVIVATELKKLVKRLSVLDETNRKILQANLLERLYLDYPNDVGCFGIYLFNYIILQPGEAIYLAANEPHAYIFGDCIECMASSDNVIRAGLTPKIKDTENLVNLLTYIAEPASAKKFQASKEDECTEIFQPPIQDFAIAKITIPPEKLFYNTIKRNSASILIIISGKAEINHSKIFDQGSVLFIEANKSLNIKVLYGYPQMLIFQAFANTVI